MTSLHPDLPLLVQAIAESETLNEVLNELNQCPVALRDAAINKMLSEMKSNNESIDSIDLISSLKSKVVFDAVISALREYRNSA